MNENRIRKIDDFNAPELDVYARMNEVQLLRCREPDPGLFIAESAKVISRALDAGYEPVSFLIEDRLLDKPEAFDYPEVPVYTASLEVLKNLTGFPMTRGALCAMRRKALPSVEELCHDAGRIAILEDVENPTNVGAIFRSAAALGVDAVLLTESCSNPLYRRASRVSMGTVFQIPWTYITRNTLTEKRCSGLQRREMPGEQYSALKKGDVWPGQGMQVLRKLGFRTAAMALCDDSIPLGDPVLKSQEKLAVILGAEGDGLARETIAECDYTVRIPMTHNVDSLNVAAASAVAFWELSKVRNNP